MFAKTALQGQGAVTKGWYVAQLRFRFTGEPLSLEDRLSNPLGFQVIEYRRDQEAAPQQTSALAPAPAPAPAAQTAVAPRPAGAN